MARKVTSRRGRKRQPHAGIIVEAVQLEKNTAPGHANLTWSANGFRIMPPILAARMLRGSVQCNPFALEFALDQTVGVGTIVLIVLIPVAFLLVCTLCLWLTYKSVPMVWKPPE